MTINNQQHKILYQGDGINREFPITFPFENSRNLSIIIKQENLADIKLSENDFYLRSDSNLDFNTVVLLQPLLKKQQLEIIRSTNILQEIRLKNYERIDGELLEAALDKIIMILQEIDGQNARSLKFSEDSTGNISIEDPKNNAGKLLIVDSSGRKISYYDASAVKTAGLYIKNNFSGDNNTKKFNLSFTAASANSLMVFVNKIIQEPQLDYVILANFIIFTNAPPFGINNIYVINLADSKELATVGDASITTQKLISGMVLPNPELQQYSQTVKSISSVGGKITIDLRLASVFECVLNEDSEFIFINPPLYGRNIGFKLFLHTGNNAYKITWPITVKFSYGKVPDLSLPNENHLLIFETINNGDKWYGALVMEAI